jgi:hypothetical protein
VSARQLHNDTTLTRSHMRRKTRPRIHVVGCAFVTASRSLTLQRTSPVGVDASSSIPSEWRRSRVCARSVFARPSHRPGA